MFFLVVLLSYVLVVESIQCTNLLIEKSVSLLSVYLG